MGVDNDPQAITATRDNAERNQITPDSIEVVLPGNTAISAWTNHSDLVVANILAGPLLVLADELMELMKPGGKLMLTGVLSEQAPELIARYASVNLEISETRDGWVLLTGQKAG